MSQDGHLSRNSLKSHLAQGLKAHESGLLEEAAACYHSILARDPSHPDALHLLGLIALQKNALPEAESYVLKALTYEQNPLFLVNLGSIKKAQGDFPAAEAAYQQALLLEPNHYEAHVNLAHTFLASNQLEKATLHYETALLITAGPETYLNLGHAYTLQGNLPRAEQCFLNALQIQPQCAPAYYRLGLLYLLKDQSDHAIAHFQEALSISPHFVDPHRELSRVFAIQGRWRDALMHAEMALPAFSTEVPFLAHYANLLLESGAKEKARHALQKAKALDENNPDIHLALGLLWQQETEHLLALSEFQKVIHLLPTSGEAHMHLAETYESLGKIKQALIHYQQAIQHNPTFLKSYAAAAHLLIKNKEFDRAYELLLTAQKQDPNHLDTLLVLFEATQYTHDFETQKAILPKLLQLTSDAIHHGVLLLPYQIKSLPLPVSCKIKALTNHAQQVCALWGKSPFSQYFEGPGRIRIGYISAHLDDQEDGILLRSIFAFHHRKHFEVFLYHIGKNTDKVSEKLIQGVDTYRDLSTFNDSDAAHRIHADGVFYLIDLSCLREGARPGIFALKPAPVALRNACDLPFFPDPTIEKWLSPQTGDEPTEGMLPYSGPATATLPFTQGEGVLDRGDFGLKETDFVYCYHGPMWRVDEACFTTWLTLLKQAPRAVLWLTANHSRCAHHLKAYFEKAGLASHRLILSPVEPITSRLRHQLADVWLEPFIGSDPLSHLAASWCALPVVNLDSKITDTGAAQALYIKQAFHFYENTASLDAARGSLLKARFQSVSFRPDIYIDALEQALLHYKSSYDMRR